MYQVIIVIHVLLGLGIIGLIMIQQGKGADAGATFGAGASGSVFGARGAASFLSRTTATLATLFFLTSLGLAILNSKQGSSYDLMNASDVKPGAVIPDASVAPAAPNVSDIPTAQPPHTESVPVVSDGKQLAEEIKPEEKIELPTVDQEPQKQLDK